MSGLFKRAGWAIAFLSAMLVMTAVDVPTASATDFCWKNSYGRGAGKIPHGCHPGDEKRGALCYEKCPAGMHRAKGTVDCHSNCPSGFVNTGLYCRPAKGEYGRGAGVGKKKCERKHGGGNCERKGGLWYQKCRAGYHNAGCCICRANRPNCRALGMGGNQGISCKKKIQVGKIRKKSCQDGYENRGGLCYKKCRAGFKGVGPVCWGKPPSNWVNCGMGAAKDKKACRSALSDQILSVGESALSIGGMVATLGGSAAATTGAKSASEAGKLAQLQKQYQDMMDLWEVAKEIPEVKKGVDIVKKTDTVAESAVQVYDAVDEGKQAVTAEDIARVAAMISAIVDPTGVSGVVAAYTYPKCSKLFK